MHLNDPEVSSLANTCDTFNVPLPALVNEAAKNRDAARQLLATVAAETAPTADGVTAANIAKVHDAMVRWENHADRLAAAQKLVDVTSAAYTHAWWLSCGSLPEQFADHFADAMERYTENLSALNGSTDAAAATRTNRSEKYNAMTAAAADISQLANLWQITRASASRVQLGSSSRQGLTQLIRVDSVDALQKAWGKYQTANNLWSPEWIAEMLSIPGVHIVWPSRGDLQTSDDIYATQRANASEK